VIQPPIIPTKIKKVMKILN